MKRYLLIFLLACLPCFGQAFNGLINMNNVSPQPPGTVVTPAILQNGTFGTGLSTPSLTGPSNFTVGAHNPLCNLFGNVVVSGTTFTPSSPSQSLNLLMTSTFDYWTTGVTNSQIYSWTACITVPGGSPAPSLIDLARTDITAPNNISVFQLADNGTHARIENNAFATSPNPANISPGQTFWATFRVNTLTGNNLLKLYQPTPPYALIGTTTISQAASGNIFRFLVGNSQTGTSTGTMQIENQLFDPTGSFPLDSITPSCTQPWCGVISSSRAIDWSGAGVTGGIPDTSTWTQSGATIAAYSGTPGTINTAIAACGANQFVQLGAGTFNLSDPIIFSNKQRCKLVGVAANQTILKFSGGATTCGTGVTCGLNIRAGDPNSSGSPSNTATWSAGFTQGSTAITLGAQLTGSLANLKVANYIILDEIDDDTLGCDNGGIWVGKITTACTTGTPSGTGINGPYSGQGNGGGARTNRAQQQMVKVVSCGTSVVGASCTSTSLTISPGLYMANWSATKTPQAWWATSPSQFIGIENIQFDSTNNGISPAPNQCSAGVGISIYNADNVWLKGVEGVLTGRAQVQINWGAHNTIRDSYFYGTQNRNSCSYGVEVFSGSDNLVENNIFQAIASPYMSNGPEGGNVFGYNGVPSTLYTAGSGFQSNDHGDHDAGNGFSLIEGNQGGIVNADDIHGTANFDSYFRDYFKGPGNCYTGPPDTTSSTATIIASGLFGPCTQNTSPFVIASFHRAYNLVGNVVGTPGWNTGYTSGAHPNFDIGHGNNGFAPPVLDDPNTTASIMLWGNSDASHGFLSPQFNSSEVPSGLTGVQAVFANPVPSTHALPASFYYTSKPSWMPASKPWPLIGPDVTGGNVSGVNGLVYTNPAMDCYNSMGGSANGISTPLNFSADVCYNGSTASGILFVSPTTSTFSLTNVGQTTGPLGVFVQNNGTATFNVTSILMSGPNASEFTFSTTCGATVIAGGNCSVNVNFAPQTQGLKSATLTITSNNASGSPKTVSLSGTAQAPPGPVGRLFAIAR